MNKKSIITILAIMLVIVCAIIVMIIFYLNKMEDNNGGQNPEAPMLYTENEVTRVSGKNIFFTIENVLNKSIQDVEKIYIKDMYTQDIEIDVNSQFYIYANIWRNNYSVNENAYIIVNLNREKLLYDLQIENSNITKQEYDEIIAQIKPYEEDNQIEIDYLENNKFSFVYASDEDVVKRNVEYYKILALYLPNEAYELLDEIYKQKRFGSIEKYFEYINNYKNILENSKIIKYAQEKDEGIDRYIGIDNYDNYYIMKGDNLYDFKMQLDNYTIESETYVEKYNNLSENKKAEICAAKVIKMINTKDYENLYNLINKNYKNNNFPTIEEFKKYINERFYKYNMVDTINIESNVNYYICSVKIRSGNNLSALESINNIIIQLGENTEFEIAFTK